MCYDVDEVENERIEEELERKMDSFNNYNNHNNYNHRSSNQLEK